MRCAHALTVVRRYRHGVLLSAETGGTTTFSSYDAFGRVAETRRVIGNSSPLPVQSFDYTPCGDLLAMHTYTNETGAITESYAYDTQGNRVATTDALGNTIHRAYDPLGNIIAEWGATYPVRYTYDTQNRRTSLSTTRSTVSTFQPFNLSTFQLAQWDTTIWAYDAATGNCLSKTYADGSTVTYTYTPDNLPLRTTYASGRWKENVYDERRQAVGVIYSDDEVVSLAYDEFGNETAASNEVSSVVSLRSEQGDCTNETIVVSGGRSFSTAAEETLTISRAFDAHRRLTGIDGMTCAYDADGLLASVSNDIAVADYAYTPDRLDAGYSLTLSNGVVFSRSLVRDDFRRSLVTSIANACSGAAAENIAYAYDALGRPTTRNADSFGYNDRGEVTSATIAGGSPSSATAHYNYDDIGNLLFSAFNSATNTYTVNNLNQYTSVLCASAPLRDVSHDADGNMTQCGDWSYTYDAANRLKTVSSNGMLLVTNFYDAKSRRVKKVTSEAATTFFYDGWNILEERVAYTNGTTATIRYFWGKDLSGTLQGAGGVGGLLYLTVSNSSTPNSSTQQLYIPCYDNNGNVTRYLDANGNIVAQYTYDAFGNIISKSGPLADFFHHRFSTKYFDVETSLYYYGYRFYFPPLMRWLNRDLLEEDGGINLYEFANNTAIRFFDPTGESPYVLGEQEPPRRTVLAAGTWNTMAAPSGTWMVRVRAKLTVWGGSWRSMPDASRHLQHFLSNSGTPLNVRFREMNRESGSAKMHLERELRDAITYAEKLANSDGGFVMVTPSETGNLNSEGNWLYAVGRYTTWARASVVKCGEKFSMNWHFYFRDIYDWELDNGAGGGLVTDREMALLHRYGLAREYEMNGRQFINVDWKKGQQFNSGARIRGL